MINPLMDATTKKAVEIPFPNMLLSSQHPAIDDGSEIFVDERALQVSYAMNPDGEYAHLEIFAKPPGGNDAKRGKKEKPKGHTDTATKRK